jgi:bifunctional DNA-binding transcriptional regulator/antitoxin component of YhaV-PrlF toxin-antitoxin module
MNCGHPVQRRPAGSRDGSMSENEDHSNKTNVELKKEYLHHCRTYEMKPYNGNSPDNLVGTLPLRDSDLQAVDAKRGDNVILYIEAKNQALATERATQLKGGGITLPVKKRQELGLDAGDSIEYWIQTPKEYESKAGIGWKKSTQSTLEDSTAPESPREDGVDDEDSMYIWVGNNDSRKYHRISSEENTQTACGIKYKSQEFATIKDPGDLLEECDDCTSASEPNLTNAELVEWICEHVGFTTSSPTSGYFENENLRHIKEYIESLEEKAAQDS